MTGRSWTAVLLLALAATLSATVGVVAGCGGSTAALAVTGSPSAAAPARPSAGQAG